MTFIPLPKTSAGGVDLSGATLGEGDLTADAWGVQKVSFPRSILHRLFTFDIPSSHWFMYENGTQVYTSTRIVSSGGAAVITADATKTVTLLESRECPRYQPNRGHLYSTALWCPSKTNDGVRDWGLFTTQNGIFFRLKADGKLYAVLRSGGSETLEQEITTTGVASFDVQKGNIYDIQFQWRGVGNYKFFINNVLVHTLSLLGTLTALSMQNPALPAAYKCTRTTQDVSMSIGCVDITSENGMTDTEVYESAYSSAVSVSTDTPVIVVKIPLLIGSVTNTRTVTLARISFNCSKKAVFKVGATRTAGDITGATYVALGNGSYVECDSTDMSGSAVRATSVTMANLHKITSVPVEAAVPQMVDNPHRGRIEFPLVRGDYLVVTCTAATATADVVVEWGEQV